MLEKLFESLDEKVFTSELKESLETKFNEAVETKAEIIAEEKINEKIDELSEKSEQHIDMLEEKAEEFVEMKEAEMLNNIDKYLERVVEEFLAEAKEALSESLKSEKADAIIEAFDSMIIATGTKVAKIVEAKDNSAVEKELEESIEKYDELVEENIALKETNETLIKMGVIAELKEGLSIVESQKFEKLAGLVEFTNDDKFVEKLETILESIKGTEDKSTEKLEESDKKDEKAPIWAHLV
jgi:hypothetical protein